jgi:hypothetical protein
MEYTNMSENKLVKIIRKRYKHGAYRIDIVTMSIYTILFVGFGIWLILKTTKLRRDDLFQDLGFWLGILFGVLVALLGGRLISWISQVILKMLKCNWNEYADKDKQLNFSIIVATILILVFMGIVSQYAQLFGVIATASFLITFGIKDYIRTLKHPV